MNPRVLSSSTIAGDNVKNTEGKNLGKIEDLMIDVATGRVAYAVLSFGGFLGLGDKLFAIPWQSLTLDTDDERFILNVSQDALKNAPGFDKDNWPSMADPTWNREIYDYYNAEPYW